MSGRVSKRMSGPAQVSNVDALKYTTPANRRAVIRHMHISNPSASPVTFTASVGADGAGTRIFDALSIGASSVYDHFGIYVLEAAETLRAHAGTNNVLVLTVDGEEEVLA